MNVAYKRRFLKELNKVPDPIKQKVQVLVFDQIPHAEEIRNIAGLKKIKGFPNYYRLRIGEYRIGLFVDKDRIVFCRILHRKDIYKYFP